MEDDDGDAKTAGSRGNPSVLGRSRRAEPSPKSPDHDDDDDMPRGINPPPKKTKIANGKKGGAKKDKEDEDDDGKDNDDAKPKYVSENYNFWCKRQQADPLSISFAAAAAAAT